MESNETLPAPLLAAGIRAEKLLDVRPVLEAGGDPFSLILKTVRALDETQALHLVVGFEPIPLYQVMEGMGRTAHTEQRDGLFHVYFYVANQSAPVAAPVEPAAVAEASPDTPLQPLVELDVCGLEPPQPMMTILQKLVELGPGAQLLVRHHREPVLLYDKLKARGYAARCTPRPEGDFLVHIAPAWSFDEQIG